MAGTVRGLPRRRERCLLAVLLLELNRVVSVDRLSLLLWDGDPPDRARRIIHSHVSRIRALLAELDAAGCGVELATVGPGYRINAEPATVDVHQFRALVAQAGEISDEADRIDRLRSALSLWRGRALENAASDWLRQRLCVDLEEHRLVAIEDLVSDSLTLRRERLVLPELALVSAEYPGREHLIALHMRALYQAGHKAEALEVYARTRTHLAEEYGLDPGVELRGLHQAILRDQLTAPVPQVSPMAGQPSEPEASQFSGPPPEVAGAVVPRQLPADLSVFAGREAELVRLDALALTADSLDSGLAIAAIDGMGGIGKTALAVRAAHRVAARFPDGQLFIDLRGFTETAAPVEPAEALERLLVALGVPGQQIPRGLDDRAGLWRSVLAGRRALIVLDNAATAAQVVPLLPGAPGCLVMVTSRRRLAGLPVTVKEVTLDMLPPPDAATLFIRMARPTQITAQQDGLVDEVTELCWRLPLAISIAAGMLRAHPAWTTSDLINRLREEHLRLSQLTDGPRSVTAVLEVSYQHLSADQQRFYRLLGLHPGPDIDAYAAAALAGTTPEDARQRLDWLLDERLLLEPTAGRYAFHDLVRGHAAGAATTVEAENSQQAPTGRLLDYYRHTAAAAAGIAHPHQRDHLPQLSTPASPTPSLPDATKAARWLDTELPNLLAVAYHGTQHGYPGHAVHLSSVLRRHLVLRGHYREAETLHHTALTLARNAGDHDGELNALAGLGNVHRLQGNYDQASDHFQQALDIAGSTGHRHDERYALYSLGEIHLVQGRYDQAADHYRRALAIASRIGDRHGELSALTGLGDVHRMQGRYEQARDHFQQALDIASGIGDRRGVLGALDGLGRVHRTQGRYEQARDHFQQALDIVRSTGDRSGELHTLTLLGRVDFLRGRCEQARDHFQQALDIARTIGERHGELSAQIGLGDVHRTQGHYEQAAEHYRFTMDIASQSSDRNTLFESLLGLGRIDHATGHPQTALAHLQQALELATDLGQPKDQARAHDGLAHTHYALHHYNQARHHWHQALAILTSLNLDNADDPETATSTIRTHLSELN